MAPTKANEIQLAEDPARIARGIEEKENVHHLEVAEDDIGLKHERDIQYDAQENEGPRTGVRRLLTRNPSYEFIREVAVMDEEPLDPPTVKRVSQNSHQLSLTSSSNESCSGSSFRLCASTTSSTTSTRRE
jgi:hypothetical protein